MKRFLIFSVLIVFDTVSQSSAAYCYSGMRRCFPQDIPIYPGVSSCGPPATMEPIQTLAPLIMNPTNGPLYILPSPPPPPPTVIGHRCYCTKTVVKPRLYQRLIQVQKNQRFLKKSYAPVIENIPYFARPR